MSHAALRHESQKGHTEKLNRMTGGESDESSDKRMISSAVHEHESALHKGEPKTKLKLANGGVAASRMDRPGRRRGGRTKGGKHVTNVIVAPSGGGGSPGGLPMPPPRPPMALPPGPPALPPGAGPGGPPGGPALPPPRPP